MLAERGVSVTVIEREPYLGGRVGGWRERLAEGEPFDMERGFHAFFRQYYNLRALLRRVDPRGERLLKLDDYPLLGPEGRRESFSGLPARPPFNLVGLVARTPSLRLKDLLHLETRSGLAMLTFDMERTYARFDHRTAREFLDSLRFPPHARRMLFNVFAHSFFNPEEEMSAAELLMMFHFYFMGNPEGLVFDVLTQPFSLALWHPLRRYLESLRVGFRLSQSVTAVEPRVDGKFRLQVEGEQPLDADAVVLATPVPALQRIVARSPELLDRAWRARVEGLALTSPFAVWRLWLDRPSRPGRAPFAGTTGVGMIDNISLYHLFESESRDWAARTGARWWSCMPTVCPEGWTRRRSAGTCWPACTSSTRSSATRGCWRSACCGVRTVRRSRRAPSPRGRGRRRPRPGWRWRGTSRVCPFPRR
ncbi:FAD-dependent oxidoreductase [Cystobacter fuscus]